jgi:uncharacterized membrane protein SpoIIM required for sporulation
VKQQRFVESRSPRWREFEALIARRHSQMSAEETGRFPELYRSLCRDLSIARANNYSPTLVARLNRLVHTGYRIFYKARPFSLRRMAAFWRVSFPATVRSFSRPVLLTALFFYGLGILSFFIVRSYPEAAYIIAGEETLSSLEAMYSPEGERLVGLRDESTDAGMFAFYIYNNVSIAFRVFAGGVFFGLGSIVILLFNGVFFGTAWAHLVNIGYQEAFLSFVIGHGFVELNAFVVCGFAGLKLGWALTAPGPYSRSHALQRSARRVLPLVYGGAGMLVVAAVIEAFWSARPLSLETKIWFAALLAAANLLYFILSGRGDEG